MSDRARWIGTVLLVLLLIYSKSGGSVPIIQPSPTAEKLWIVALTDVPTSNGYQTIALDVSRWEVNGHKYEHYLKPSAEASKFSSVSKFADEAIFMDAANGKVLGVVEIPERPAADWSTSQIARFAK